MNKRMRELLAAMKAKREEAKGYMTEGESKDVAKATTLLDEADSLQQEFNTEKRLFEASKDEIPDGAIEKAASKAKGGYTESVKAFANAARVGFKGLNEGTPANGGYTVPEDIVTKIYELRQAKRSLIDLVTVTTVKTMSGSRTFKKRSQVGGFTKVGEGGKISATGTPAFGRIEYDIDKYAGYMPITNELLDDTDENIVSIISEWFADESRVTQNKLILETADSKYVGEDALAPVVISGIDDIKKVLNVTLGQAFKPTSKIVTNDDGLQWLDTLKDSEGKYLLQPNPADPMRMQLCAGATTVPVDVVPNADLQSDTTKGTPVYIGDFKEGIELFDRKMLSIMASNVAAIGDLNAYEEDLTLYRGIEREDVVLRDEEAFVKGYIAIAEG